MAELRAGQSRHWFELVDDGHGQHIIRVGCGLGGEVSVLQTRGLLAFPQEADGHGLEFSGPLLVKCQFHGNYIAFFHCITLPSNLLEGEKPPISVPLVMLALGESEYAPPIQEILS